MHITSKSASACSSLTKICFSCSRLEQYCKQNTIYLKSSEACIYHVCTYLFYVFLYKRLWYCFIVFYSLVIKLLTCNQCYCRWLLFVGGIHKWNRHLLGEGGALCLEMQLRIWGNFLGTKDRIEVKKLSHGVQSKVPPG